MPLFWIGIKCRSAKASLWKLLTFFHAQNSNARFCNSVIHEEEDNSISLVSFQKLQHLYPRLGIRIHHLKCELIHETQSKATTPPPLPTPQHYVV